MAHILVIDDDEQVRYILRRALERAGHSVAQAVDGEAGIRQYRAQPADLVITDIFMPGQDGLETILQLRREFAGVKIIAMSGGDRTGAIDLRKEAGLFGASQTLLKPFRLAELSAVVSTALAQHEVQSGPPKEGNAGHQPPGGG